MRWFNEGLEVRVGVGGGSGGMYSIFTAHILPKSHFPAYCYPKISKSRSQFYCFKREIKYKQRQQHNITHGLRMV